MKVVEEYAKTVNRVLSEPLTELIKKYDEKPSWLLKRKIKKYNEILIQEYQYIEILISKENEIERSKRMELLEEKMNKLKECLK